MGVLNKLKTFCGWVGIITLLVMFCLPQERVSVFAACAKENDCLSCHTAQELKKVHKDVPYLNQGCLACHKAPEVSSDWVKRAGTPCRSREKIPDAGAPGSAEITSEIHLGHEEWEKMQRAVHETVEKHLVGRRFIEVYGPLGTGVHCVPHDTYSAPSWAGIDMLGEAENSAVHPLKRDIAHIPLIYKDFWLFYRDIEAAGKCDMPLDLSTAIGAAAAVAGKEDDLIFNGSQEMGISGLLNVNGRNTMKLSDWSAVGNGFQDVVTAVEKLISSGFSGPFALVVSPKLYAYLNRVYERTGQLEVKGVQELVKGGVYQSYVLKKDVALVVAMGRMNMDIAVGTDYKVEYWGPQDLNHRFRVVGSAVLRIKCPQAICTLE